VSLGIGADASGMAAGNECAAFPKKSDRGITNWSNLRSSSPNTGISPARLRG